MNDTLNLTGDILVFLSGLIVCLLSFKVRAIAERVKPVDGRLTDFAYSVLAVLVFAGGLSILSVYDPLKSFIDGIRQGVHGTVVFGFSATATMVLAAITLGIVFYFHKNNESKQAHFWAALFAVAVARDIPPLLWIIEHINDAIMFVLDMMIGILDGFLRGSKN